MKTIGIITLALLTGLLLPVAIQPAAAALPAASGLEVALLQGDLTIASTATDTEGRFSLSGIAAGSYSLTLGDTAGTMLLRFPLEVPSTVEPAKVEGRVEVAPEIAIGFSIEVRVTSASGLSVDEATVKPAKWNLNYSHSHGHLKVVLTGTGLAEVTSVTLSSATGSIPSTDIRVRDAEDDEDDDDPVDTEKACVFFTKSAAWEALVPADAARGDIIPLEIIVEGAGYSATFTQDITILGRHRPTR